MTGVEPMYCGTAVVASSYPAILEAVGDGALTLCPYRSSAQQWRQAVDQVLADVTHWQNKARLRTQQLDARQTQQLQTLSDYFIEIAR